jgi:hypothetical protein
LVTEVDAGFDEFGHFSLGRGSWSRPVYVMFDANADGRLIPPDAKAEGSGELPISVAVFSAGPDGIPGNEDDITSWRG